MKNTSRLYVLFGVSVFVLVSISAGESSAELLGRAEGGDVEAQCDVAHAYMDGTRGFKKDPAAAVTWATKAAERGSGRALNALGWWHYTGEGLPKNLPTAIDLFRAAIEQKHTLAMLNLGYIIEHGLGTPQDLSEAARLYKLAGDSGNPQGHHNFANMLYAGRGIQANPAEAARLFRGAADKGYANSQFVMGNLYRHGLTVEKNAATALDWYKKAAAQGHEGGELGAGMKLTLSWSCADTADVYLNGSPLRNVAVDFRTRPDEANKEFSAEVTVKAGDVITVGGRRGGSYGFMLIAHDKNKKSRWTTGANWRVYYPSPENQARWFMPDVALKSHAAMPVIQPNPWGPQQAMNGRFGNPAKSIWNGTEPTGFLYGIVGD